MTEDKKRVITSPLVRKLAKADNVDLSQITGTGNNGAILKTDYLEFTGQTDEPAQDRADNRYRDDEQRSPMNHLTDDTRQLDIGGMKFTRSRESLDHSTRKTIDIPENCKNNELHYRVVSDDNGKLQAAKKLGYQIVDNLKDPHTGENIDTQYRVGTKKDGSDLYGHLMATPKIWKQERDNHAENERLDRERGLFKKPTDDQGQVLGDEFYDKGSRFTEKH